MFPSPDPIPLPAPVWLLKALHITTLSLHFVALEMLLGGLLVAVIFLLMACYWLLYRFSAGLESDKRAWFIGLAAWLLAGSIAKIYSSNMTLMLRPEAWSGMYSSSAAGVHLPAGDPTLVPRWRWRPTNGTSRGWAAGWRRGR